MSRYPLSPPDRTEFRHKFLQRSGVGDETRPQTDYVAKLASSREVCDLTRVLAGPDRVVAWVAERQLALITTPQLQAAGLSHDAIRTRCRKGLLHRVHHGVYLFGSSRFFDPADVRELRGIPIVSPARALLDYAAMAASAALERAIAEAYALRLTTEREISRTVARNPSRPGVGPLRAELAREQGPAWTRRQGERQVAALIRKADLPPPLTNVVVAGY
jgi:Transcriptional regulator, AbiEi antitoxin